jgi:glycosyltransferase involved in cell wall biosynthesis
VVVIARNEERHIAACLEAVLHAIGNLPQTQVIVVDSGSTDRTVQIARAYPVQIYRYAGPKYSAAAGRRVGFERARAQYVLFVDGDCCMEPGWIEVGLERLEADLDAAVVYGRRREVFEDGTARAAHGAPAAEEYGLGGNALYRSDALRSAGGFNPYLIAGEEGELLGRLAAAGYRAIAIPRTMFTHHTLAKSSVRGFVSRLRRGLARGRGQTLRVAIGQGLFLYQARRLNRYLSMLAYLFAGMIAGAVALVLHRPAWLAAWVACGAMAFLVLWLRRRSLRSAAYIFADWIVVALHLPADFLRRPSRPERFSPTVEQLR